MHQCDYCCWYYNGNCDCPQYKMFQTPKPANEISWKDMKEFNSSYMKEVVRDYKIKQAKSIQSARNVIIS